MLSAECLDAQHSARRRAHPCYRIRMNSPRCALPGRLLPKFAAAAILIGLFPFAPPRAAAQDKTVWSDQEKPIVEKLRTLRKLPDDERAITTKQLALQIRELPQVPNKLRLADGLSSLATEGDFGRDTLQEVTNTLAQALREQPVPDKAGQPAYPYIELANLAKYEHMQVPLDAPQLAEATAKLEADDQARQKANFTLTDLKGKSWTLQDLRGNVVMVNFWATWCPPCRKEMPDLETLSQKFQARGLIILGISDEELAKVQLFITEKNYSYPILLDPADKVHKLFQVEGIPKSFVYDREGKLVTQSIDMRTQKQFLEMLKQAGLE
jgi:peroxiredoxin